MIEILINKFEWVWSKRYNERAWYLFVCEELVCSDDLHLRECFLSKLLLWTFKTTCIYIWGVTWWSSVKIEMLDTF